SYVVPIAGDDLVHSFGKQLHVSPFNGMDQGYQFTISPPSSRISVSIEQSEKGTRFFRAGLALSRMPLSDSNLIRLFVTHPLLSLKVISAIHWQALRLWIKGATFHRRPEPAADSISIIRSRSAVG
ncbi:MAG: DUF1365 family protein, partial [Acidimicrobiia bacterium]